MRYVNIQKARKIRIAFSSLADYAKKENRNGFTYTNQEIKGLNARAFDLLHSISTELKTKNTELIAALESKKSVNSSIEIFIASINYNALLQNNVYMEVKAILAQIMDIAASEIASLWDDPRYSREIVEE